MTREAFMAGFNAGFSVGCELAARERAMGETANPDGLTDHYRAAVAELRQRTGSQTLLIDAPAIAERAYKNWASE